MTKVALTEEDGLDNNYKMVITANMDTPSNILEENNINYKTRDVFLNGKKLTESMIAQNFQALCSTDNIVFLSVRNKRVKLKGRKREI